MEKGRVEKEKREREERENIAERSSAFCVCVSLNGEHGTDTKGSEGKQCRLTRHHWLIISNLLWA